MLPSILAKQLEKGIGDYLETTFPMTNEPFRGSLRNMIETKDSLYHEPYIAVRLPFRVAEEMPTCFEAVHPAYLPYVHQQKAFERLTGDDGRSTLVSTGTGSGKTECFLYPILEYCYQHRGERGIKALIIYPMNALAADQAKRIAELIYNSPELRSNVTAGMYVGGFDGRPSTMMSESNIITDKVTMLNNPPDILLTNYKMLDYLLVRPNDSDLWKDNKDSEVLKYIAVDELHTFDGAQGTDLACLLRRLKSRLGIQPGYLCCVGTSATMGGEGSNENIRQYASEIFGEPFEKDSVIVEDRLSPEEFFAESEITDFAMPTYEQILALENCIEQDDQKTYLKTAISAWIDDYSDDPLSDEGRISLGEKLMHHSFMKSVISFMGGNYYQESAIVENLIAYYPALKDLGDGQTALDALFSLISYARTGTPGGLRPFLNVQVQLWLRELRRFLGKVSGENVTYAIAHDLNAQQAKQYLPIVNCRDCGATGWTALLNERQNATTNNLEAFYNRYFKCDDKVVMMFPHEGEETPYGTISARLCPDCLQVHYGDGASELCDNCGGQTIPIYIPTANK
ncbi:MAG: DEAD/DEAH box helicase, partial [Holdemanella sp.]|nr:DEAD/DEAH box helicase [Holdemanella sp.]